MSAIRKLIEDVRSGNKSPLTDDAMAELKELEGKLKEARLEFQEELSARAERDRADAELLEAWLAQQGDWQNIERARAVFVALCGWAAAKGGGKR